MRIVLTYQLPITLKKISLNLGNIGAARRANRECFISAASWAVLHFARKQDCSDELVLLNLFRWVMGFKFPLFSNPVSRSLIGAIRSVILLAHRCLLIAKLETIVVNFLSRVKEIKYIIPQSKDIDI